MKKGTIAGLLAAAAALVGLLGLAAYLTVDYREVLLPSGDHLTESEIDAVILSLRETEAPDTPAELRDPSGDGAGEEPIIWVGDSRTLGMQNAMDNDDIYIGKSGEGYDWFAETGLEEMEDAIEAHPASPVVLNFGVNDYDNLDLYMKLYTSLTEEHADTHFYFLSVNPIDPELCKNITNEEIADFNRHLQELFPDTYIDSSTQILASEILPLDGVHYSKDDYRFIYRYAVGKIKEMEDGSGQPQ